MEIALVKLIYRQVIDASSAGDFEKRVLNASYEEFLLKSQAYNLDKKYRTFTELKAGDGRANSLHYKLGFSVGHFIEALNNCIPVLMDNLGNGVNFDIAKFELIESDLKNKAVHKVAINYITGTLTLCRVIGEYLVLAKGDIRTFDGPAETFIMKMQPSLCITSYQLQQAQLTNGNQLYVNYSR